MKCVLRLENKPIQHVRPELRQTLKQNLIQICENFITLGFDEVDVKKANIHNPTIKDQLWNGKWWRLKKDNESLNKFMTALLFTIDDMWQDNPSIIEICELQKEIYYNEVPNVKEKKTR